MGKLRLVLLGLVLLSAVTSVSGAGTFASFNASTENPGSFDTGVLALSNTKQAGTVCYSFGALNGNGEFASNSNPACADVFFPVSTVRSPSATELTFNVTLRNDGDIPASLLKFYVPSCTTANDSPGIGVHGPAGAAGSTSDLCTYLFLAVQETSSSWGTITAPQTALGCRYPTVTSGSPCATPSTSLYTAKGAIGTTATAVAINNSVALPGASLPDPNASPCSASPTSCRYYQVRVLFPNGASGNENNVMGKVATFQFGWLLEQ